MFLLPLVTAPACLIPEISIADYQIPAALNTVTGSDGTIWEQVNQPGFGSDNNMSVVAMAEYQGCLAAMTRNEVQGVEVWRRAGTEWEQVLFPDVVTNGVYDRGSATNAFRVKKDKETGIPVKLQFP